MTENTEMVRLQEENAQLRARVSELETEVEGLVEDQARFEASVQIIEELLKRYQGLREEYTALKALSEDRLATSEQIINTLASDEDEADLDEEDGDVDDVEFTETVERLDAAMQLIDEMVDRMQSLVREEAAAEELLEAAINFCREGVLEAYADDLTQNLANGGEIKSMLLEHCPDVASMDAMFGKLRVITEAVVPAGLPLNEEQDMLLQEDTFDDHRAIEERPMSEGAKLALHLVQKLGLS